ncbi:hypothetical protein BGX34_008067 [Mortierella sp. NVP85]|nr:hypothetical protein BGX34_008067 [Mortierella sp. NVP85]
MITVPPQELAIFLGNHLEQVLQRTGRDFVQSVAANRQFRAGCALMDVLNDVESVQGRIQAFLQERRNSNGDQETVEPVNVRITSLYLLYSLYSQFPIHQNPFLCLFVDIYTTSLLDEQQRPERFVVSVILNGDGDELSPSTPSELIMIAREVESRRVNLRSLDDFLPDVPVKDQVVPGLGWESFGLQRPGDQGHWRVLNLQDSFGGAGRLQVQGDHTKDDGGSLLHGGDNVNGGNGRPPEIVSTTGTGSQGQKKDACSDGEEEGKEEEQELEEWEIEAEKHFQDSEDVAPAPAKAIAKPKKSVDPPFNRQQLNAIMEQAAIQPLTFVEEQFMLSQFNADAIKVHIPLPLPDALPGIVDNNPPIAFNLLLYLSQLSSDLDGGDAVPPNQRSNGGSDGSGRASAKSSSFNSPEPSLVDAYLDTLNYAKHLTLHSVEVVNRLATATTLPSRFLHAYIENGIRCCEQVEDKVGQTRQIQLLSKLLQSLLASETITIPDYFHALQSFCVQFSRVKEVAVLFQSLMDYQRKNDTQSPVQNQGLSIRATQQPAPLQQQQSNSRTLPQSASMPSTPTTDTPQRSSWLASSGSIANVKSTLSKHNSLNGFSAPGALSQFIHPGPASPAGTGSSSSGSGSNHQNGGGYSSNHSFSNGTGSGSSYFKTHQKHSSQHSSSTGSLFSSSGVMSASVNAFNSGLGNPTSLTLNGGSSNNSGGGSGLGSFRSRSSSTITTSASGSGGTMDNGYDDAAPRTTTPSGTSGSGGGASNSSGSSRPLSSGSQQQQQQQTIHLGPKGFNTASHLGNHARGRGARRGG